jgi:hypothetical protein
MYQKKVIVETMGGIGNQLFQYAFGKSLSIKRKCTLYLDNSWFEKEHGNIYAKRLFRLNFFKCQYREMNWILKKMSTLSKTNSEIIYRYDPLITEKINFINKYHGYWQSYKYFDFAKTSIQSEIQLKEKSDAYKLMEHNIKQNDYLCIHIRRGDYFLNPMIKDIHGVITIDYYQEAINYLESKFGLLRKLIFSDDPDWCKNNLQVNKSYKIFKNNNFNDYEELTLMAKCKYFIIANSSFSWWAAYLSETDETRIVAPQNWFKDSSLEPQNIIPENWMRINNSFL